MTVYSDTQTSYCTNGPREIWTSHCTNQMGDSVTEFMLMRRDRYMYVCLELIFCVGKLNLGLIVDIIISSIVDLDVELYGSLAYLLLSECSLIST